jgi:FSR family fosmidomycin resistance protein-like MFS transporter
MSIFGAGGAVGFALASLAAPLLHDWGLRLGMKPLQGLVFALPLGLAGAYLLWRYNPHRALPEEEERFSLRAHLLPHLAPLAPLFGVMILRAGTVTSYGTFIQVLEGKLGHSALYQGATLFAFIAGGAIGGLLGGHLSDLYGRRCTTIISLLLSPPLLYYALHAGVLSALALLFVAGFTVRGAESVNIAQTQDLLPQGMSTASALSMGFVWGVAGIIPALVGLISDRTNNLAFALATTIVLPVIAAGLAVMIPTHAPGQKT